MKYPLLTVSMVGPAMTKLTRKELLMPAKLPYLAKWKTIELRCTAIAAVIVTFLALTVSYYQILRYLLYC